MAVSKVESRTVSECSLNNITSMDPLNEEWYENLIVEHLTEKLGYEHLYGPDVRRTDDSYRDVFLPDILPDALRRINRNLPEAAVEEAIRKIQNVEIGSLEQRNEIFNDYLQSGVEVHFFDGKEERDDIVRLLDFDDPENNDFHVRAQRVLRDERYDPDQGRHDHIRRGPLRGLEVGGRRLFRNESRGMEHHD